MLSQPRNRKYKKGHKSPLKGLQGRANRLSYGSHGLKYIGPPRYAHLTAAHCEAARRVIVRGTRRIGHIYIRTFPYHPISKKPTKTRMGKGKGAVHEWVCPIKPGQILFEISGGISERVAGDILKRASHKLPVATRLVGRFEK